MENAIRENAPRGTKGYPFKKLPFEVEIDAMNIVYHWHPEIEILLGRKGGFTVNIDGREYKAEDGDLFFVSPDSLHSVEGGEGKEKSYDALIFFPSLFSFFEKNDIEEKIIAPLTEHRISLPERITKKNEGYEEIFPLLERVSLINDTPDDSARMETTILLLSVFLVLFRKNLFKIPLSEKIEITRLRSVISYIEENFKKKITLDELALVSGFSVGHFSSFFKKGTGKTPIEYLNEVRINKAREKLLTTDESVTSISLECGFENLGYFIRLFKKTNGSSPKIWRKSTKQ